MEAVEMVPIITRNIPLLTDEQRVIYDRMMLASWQDRVCHDQMWVKE